MSDTELITHAIDFYNQGDYKLSQKYADNIIKKNQNNADAWVIKGNIFYQSQKLVQSLSCYQKAINIDSKNINALINAANANFELEKYMDSFSLSQQVLRIDSYHKTALNIFGNSCIELDKYDEAKTAFLKLLEQDSSDVWSYNSLSKIYQKTNDNKRALECGWKAVELSQGSFEHHLNFGYLLYELGGDEASEYAEKWLQKYGDNNIVKHIGNALIHKEKITKANVEYVSKMFDVFADDFDKVLTSLEYNAPQLILKELEQIRKDEKVSKLSILDAGCGTGMCGELLKKYSKFHGLYGVDISVEMLKKAKQKKCYYKLVQDDLECYLSNPKKQFDMIVSSDVLTYFGDLETIILGFAKTLKNNGRLIFTISKNMINDKEYFLHTSGRFVHSIEYIKKLLQNNGFSIKNVSENVLRKEGDIPVVGYLVYAKK